jgi:hypothetical protein
MNKLLLIGLMTVAMLSGCAAVSPGDLKPGASADEIRTQMGTPRATYALPGGGQRLEFRGSGPRTFMVDVDASGRLIDWVQVLNETNFRNIVAGMGREQVLMTLGQPDQTEPAGRMGGQFWFWHFQNSQCLWFQVHIGADGRTTGAGAQTMLPACMNAASGR